jgi:hypothetical protein
VGERARGRLRSTYHGNGDGTNVGAGSLEVSLRALGDIGVSGAGGTNVGSVEAALALDGLVGVGGLGVNTVVLDDVLESLVHQTTVAGEDERRRRTKARHKPAIVTLGTRAVNEVLLRERDEVSSGKAVLSLEGAGGREGPARAALSLVLDRGDDTLGAPVDLGGEGANIGGGGGLGDGGGVVLGNLEVQLAELGVEEIGEPSRRVRCGGRIGERTYSLTPRVKECPSLLKVLMYSTLDS